MKNKIFSLIVAIFLCSYNSANSDATEYSYNCSNSNTNYIFDQPGNITLDKFITIFTSNIQNFCFLEYPIEINFCDYDLNFIENKRNFYGFQLIAPEIKQDLDIGVYWILTEKKNFILLCSEFMELQMRSTHKTRNISPKANTFSMCSDLLNNLDWRYKKTLCEAIELENAPNTYLDIHVLCNRKTDEIILLCEKNSSSAH